METWGILELMGQKSSPIHMPRWASRLTLEITGVKVERLQSISEADAQAEGMEKAGLHWSAPGVEMTNVYGDKASDIACHDTAKEAFRCAWNAINQKCDWWENPWVWAITFRKVEASR